MIAAYDAPFPDDSYKAGVRQFPMLVPSQPDDPASDANRAAWESLRSWTKPFLTAFSDHDPITAGADRVLRADIPGCQGQPHTTITNAGHFLQEDAGEELARRRRRVRRRDLSLTRGGVSLHWRSVTGVRRSAPAAAALAVLVSVVAVWRVPAGVLVQGTIVGSLTSLVALGLALVWRANRVINFAAGDLGSVPAVLAVLLTISTVALNWWVALVAGLATALLVGARSSSSSWFAVSPTPPASSSAWRRSASRRCSPPARCCSPATSR